MYKKIILSNNIYRGVGMKKMLGYMVASMMGGMVGYGAHMYLGSNKTKKELKKLYNTMSKNMNE